MSEPAAYAPEGRRLTSTVVIVAVIAMATLVTGLVAAIAFSPRGFDASTTPVVATVLGFIANAVIALLTLLRADQTRQELRNGLIPAKLAEAVENGVATGVLTENRAQKRTRASDNISQEGNDDG